jgi:hypothetical protein
MRLKRRGQNGRHGAEAVAAGGAAVEAARLTEAGATSGNFRTNTIVI